MMGGGRGSWNRRCTQIHADGRRRRERKLEPQMYADTRGWEEEGE
jgi:hypothetical protein